jgi:hypothetical protein
MSDMTFAEAAEVLKRPDVNMKVWEGDVILTSDHVEAIEVALRALEDVEAQASIIVRQSQEIKRLREAMNGQSEYEYLGGDLISREALVERIENIDWYHREEVGTSTVMWHGACSEEEAWFKAPDIFAAVRDALAVEAEPVVHAHWVPAPDVGDCCYRCSHCGKVIDHYCDEDDAYCARCGAHMDEK